MPNDEDQITTNYLEGTDRFFYQTSDNSSSNIENEITVPFSQVFTYVEGNIPDNVEAYTLQDFYKNVLNVFHQPMYVYYGETDPANNPNINIWIDTNKIESQEQDTSSTDNNNSTDNNEPIDDNSTNENESIDENESTDDNSTNENESIDENEPIGD